MSLLFRLDSLRKHTRHIHDEYIRVSSLGHTYRTTLLKHGGDIGMSFHGFLSLLSLDIDADPYLQRGTISTRIGIDKVRFGRREVGKWESNGAKCARRKPVIRCDDGSDDVWMVECDERDILQLFREQRRGRMDNEDGRTVPFERNRSSQALTGWCQPDEGGSEGTMIHGPGQWMRGTRSREAEIVLQRRRSVRLTRQCPYCKTQGGWVCKGKFAAG